MYGRPSTVITATIADTSDVSSPIATEHYNHFGLIFPAAIDGASITFEVGPTSAGPWKALKKDATAVSINVLANDAIGIDSGIAALRSFPWWRIKTASAQTADRSIVVTKAVQ